jgi:hypothetical protein
MPHPKPPVKKTIANPAVRGSVRAVTVTDRALRYRAANNPPAGPRRCHYCGNPNARDVEHIDGREENGEPRNLAYACRSCNTKKGIVFRNAKIGRRTRQYNPAGPGARTVGEYIEAALTLKGQGQKMKLADAIQIMADTPHERRAQFASEIWDRYRRPRGTTRTGREALPF